MVSLPDHLRSIPLGEEKLPREVMEAHQRSRLIEAAIEVFAEKGYAATTIDDLVASGKTGVGTFYAHFDGKENCLLAVYDAIVAEGRERVLQAAGEADSWRLAVCFGLKHLLDWLAANPARGRVACVEILAAGPAGTARQNVTLQSAVEALRKGRAEAPATAQLPASLEHTTVNGIAWLLGRKLATGGAGDLPSLYGELAELVLEPYLGEAEARSVVADT